MSALDDFLNLNDVCKIQKTISIMIEGKKFDLVIRPLTENEHREFQRQSNTFKKNKLTFDSGKYTSLMVESCIVEPNFKDAEFLKKVGCVSAMEFFEKKFPAGVIMDIGQKIQEISGFDGYDVEVDNAKN